MKKLIPAIIGIITLTQSTAYAQNIFDNNLNTSVASKWPGSNNPKVNVENGKLKIKSNYAWDTNGLHIKGEYQTITSNSQWLNFTFRKAQNSNMEFIIRSNGWGNLSLNQSHTHQNIYLNGVRFTDFEPACIQSNIWNCLQPNTDYTVSVDLHGLNVNTLEAFGIKEDGVPGDVFILGDIALEFNMRSVQNSDDNQPQDEPLPPNNDPTPPPNTENTHNLYTDNVFSDPVSRWFGQGFVIETSENVAGNTTNKLLIETTKNWDTNGFYTQPTALISSDTAILTLSVYKPNGSNVALNIRTDDWTALNSVELSSAIITHEDGQTSNTLRDGWNTVRIDLNNLGKTKLHAVGLTTVNSPNGGTFYLDNAYLGTQSSIPPENNDDDNTDHNNDDNNDGHDQDTGDNHNSDQPINTNRPDNISVHFKRNGNNITTKNSPNNSFGYDGQFRILCGFASIEQTDPILQANNSPRSHHMHSFYGSDLDVEVTTSRMQLLQEPNSTCSGGGVNRSLYWIPTMVAINDNPNVPYEPVEEISFFAYYKTDFDLYGSKSQGPDRMSSLPSELPVEWFNLRMVAHPLTSKELKTLESAPYGEDRRTGVQWQCNDIAGKRKTKKFGGMPNCSPGDVLNLQFWFPHCLNTLKQPKGSNAENPAFYTRQGQELWLQYAAKRANTSDGCPINGQDDNWVRIPVQSFSVSWRVPSSGMNNWYLSSDLDANGTPLEGPRGSTAHGDFMNGWSHLAPTGEEEFWDNQAIAQAWYRECLILMRDCTKHLRPNGNGKWRFTVGDSGQLFTNR